MRRISFVAAVVFAVAGCGLSDYERRMDEQRERLRLFDEEATLLGNMIEMPSGKDAYGNPVKAPFEIFLRFPKSVSASYTGPQAIYVSDKQPLFRYVGNKQDVNIFVALAKVHDKLSLSKPAEDEIDPAVFRAKVRGGLIEFVTREYKGNLSLTPPEFDKLKSEKRETLRDGKPHVLHLESIEFADPRRQEPAKFHVFFQTLFSRQAAVIYHVPAQQSTDQAWQRTMDVSLKTLEITSSAATARNLFRSRQ